MDVEVPAGQPRRKLPTGVGWRSAGHAALMRERALRRRLDKEVLEKGATASNVTSVLNEVVGLRHGDKVEDDAQGHVWRHRISTTNIERVFVLCPLATLVLKHCH